MHEMLLQLVVRVSFDYILSINEGPSIPSEGFGMYNWCLRDVDGGLFAGDNQQLLLC